MAEATKNKTAIYMTEEEQRDFVRLQKYSHIIEELDRINFYDMRGGSVELHKDRYGNLSTIVQHNHIIVAILDR